MCVSGLTTVFAVVTAVWVLSSTSSWDLHQTRLGYWHKEGQKIMKTAQGVNNILGLKKKKKKDLTEGNYSLLETWVSAPSFGHLSKHQQWVLERNLASLGLWLLYYCGTYCHVRPRYDKWFGNGLQNDIWMRTDFQIYIKNYIPENMNTWLYNLPGCYNECSNIDLYLYAHTPHCGGCTGQQSHTLASGAGCHENHSL